ncbi:uncharacterized protein LOC120353615 [Nilaparvata lugens]|uniref:uncharacterized protein LOC120353615 n=1 Tax=Nilaparvata lugens TaxID=108931 RepID=UPI00193D3BFB|nr:uncharacterized protein LOC120353615 [Nilaparvata lugens]
MKLSNIFLDFIQLNDSEKQGLVQLSFQPGLESLLAGELLTCSRLLFATGNLFEMFAQPVRMRERKSWTPTCSRERQHHSWARASPQDTRIFQVMKCQSLMMFKSLGTDDRSSFSLFIGFPGKDGGSKF